MKGQSEFLPFDHDLKPTLCRNSCFCYSFEASHKQHRLIRQIHKQLTERSVYQMDTKRSLQSGRYRADILLSLSCDPDTSDSICMFATKSIGQIPFNHGAQVISPLLIRIYMEMFPRIGGKDVRRIRCRYYQPLITKLYTEQKCAYICRIWLTRLILGIVCIH